MNEAPAYGEEVGPEGLESAHRWDQNPGVWTASQGPLLLHGTAPMGGLKGRTLGFQ